MSGKITHSAHVRWLFDVHINLKFSRNSGPAEHLANVASCVLRQVVYLSHVYLIRISSISTEMELDLRITIVFALILCPSLVSGCSRMQCAPIISKCQLIEACRCDPGLDYICAKNCSDCLGDLFAECCSCVGKSRQNIQTVRVNRRKMSPNTSTYLPQSS